MAAKTCLGFHSGVELAQLSKRENVIFLDVKATSAGCDGAPYSIIFLDTKAFPVRTLNNHYSGWPMFSAASAIRFAGTI